jgi:hypothetical protein
MQSRIGIYQVTSSCLCKKVEGAGFPFQVKSLEDGVDDSVHAFDVDKANRGPGTPAHFDKAALDHVGGAQFAPEVPGKSEERQQLRQILLTGQAEAAWRWRRFSSLLHFRRSAVNSDSSFWSSWSLERTPMSLPLRSTRTDSHAATFRVRSSINSLISRREKPSSCIWRIK